MSLQDDINKLKVASRILLDRAQLIQCPKFSYREIKSSDSVREAWEEVGNCFRKVFDELTAKDE